MSKNANKPNAENLKMNFILLKPKNALFRLDVLPFITIYPILIFPIIFTDLPAWFQQIIPVIFVLGQAITFLSSYWSVHMKSRILFDNVKNFENATHVLTTKNFRKENRSRTQLCEILTSKTKIYIEYYKKKYIWNPISRTFEKEKYFYNKTFDEYINSQGFINEADLMVAYEKYGTNTMDIPMPKFFELFKEHIVAPFFVFQIFCTMLWMFEEYWYFSGMSFIMIFVFESSVVFSRIKNMERIRGMRIKHREMKVYREMHWKTINSSELVPGDIVCVEVKNGGDAENRLPCDMLLLSGNCTVNESILTGESIPLAKEAIISRDNLNESFDIKSNEHKSHILFGRTEVLHCSRDLGKPLNLLIPAPPSNKCCVAYVLRTGFNTTQGKLVRTVLFTAERVTVESKEAYLFLLLLLFFAIMAAGYTLYEGLNDPERNKYKVIVKSILILAAVVPPDLPMQLSISVNSSIISLIRSGIFCTEPYRIPLSGKITTCCFDKTGTLTSDKIKINGILDENGINLIQNSTENSQIILPTNTQYVLGLCHSLTISENNIQIQPASNTLPKNQPPTNSQNGTLIIGDPMEKLAFEQIGWKFDRQKEIYISRDGKITGEIIAKYSFSSQLKRMSVLAEIKGNDRKENEFYVLTKGAPEILKNMFNEIPKDFDKIVQNYTKQGSRLICMAYKKLSEYGSGKLQREDAEKNLHFCGFLATSCPLKKDTKNIVSQLKNSNHHIVIITGDNQYTAAHVAFEINVTKPENIAFFKPPSTSNTIPSLFDINDNILIQSSKIHELLQIKRDLCMTGEGLNWLDNVENTDWEIGMKNKLIQKTAVFARVSPSQKDHIVSVLNQLGDFTLMCGDGTNDVGSLKRAHAGIALLNREETAEEKKRNEALFLKAMNEPVMADGDASIAAPFTYKYDSIKCVTDVLRQGRCALVTTIQMYKILAINCLMLAYSLSVLYQQGLKSGDIQSTIFAIPITIYFYFISNAKPLDKLHPYKPPHSIFVLSQIVPIGIQFITHISGLYYLTQLGLAFTKKEDIANPDGSFKPSILNTVVMIYLSFVDATNFFINYEGEPFMESLWSGKVLPKILVLHMLGLVVAALDISVDLRGWLQLKELPEDFPGYQVILIMAVDFVICLGTRMYVRRKLYGAIY